MMNISDETVKKNAALRYQIIQNTVANTNLNASSDGQQREELPVLHYQIDFGNFELEL